MTINKILKQKETYALLTTLLLAFAVQIGSGGQFFTGNNLIDLARAWIVPGLFAISSLVIMITGGVDVSFPHLASLSIYIATSSMIDMNYQGSALLPFVICLAVGAVLGAINGLLVNLLQVPDLIVTLATQSIFMGILQGALSAVLLPVLPVGMKAVGTWTLFSYTDPKTELMAKMPGLFLVFIAVVLLSWFLLKYTMWGRGLYAIGGDAAAAKRAGFNVARIRVLAYIYSGVVASIGGFCRVTMMGLCQPVNMFNMGTTVIASVVLGGASLSGGKGTVIGAMIGILLLTLVESNMLLLGIPVFWQKFFVGVVIVAGMVIANGSNIWGRKRHKRGTMQSKEASV